MKLALERTYARRLMAEGRWYALSAENWYVTPDIRAYVGGLKPFTKEKFKRLHQRLETRSAPIGLGELNQLALIYTEGGAPAYGSLGNGWCSKDINKAFAIYDYALALPEETRKAYGTQMIPLYMGFAHLYSKVSEEARRGAKTGLSPQAALAHAQETGDLLATLLLRK
jgi:hypothetical protein